MEMLQHPGSWWADPSVQWDRDAFRAAVAQQAARWQDDDKRIQSVMAGLATQNWVVGGMARRRMAGGSAVMS
jgi:hypothetical protein